jgi:hypothetical protein
MSLARALASVFAFPFTGGLYYAPARGATG